MTKAPVRFEAEEFYLKTNGQILDHVNARIADYFKDAVEVGGSQGPSGGWVFSERNLTNPNAEPTHRAYLVGIEKIEKGVTKDEIVLALKNAKIIVAAGTKLKPGDIEMHPDLRELADRIEREGIRP